MFNEKFIKGHWDTMSEQSRQIYLEQRTYQVVTRVVCLTLATMFLGGVALEPSCEKADMGTLKLQSEKDKLLAERAKTLEALPSYQIRMSYQACIDRCFHTSHGAKNRDLCPQKCGDSVKMIRLQIPVEAKKEPSPKPVRKPDLVPVKKSQKPETLGDLK